MIIKTYKELSFFVNMFKNGHADLLIIESRGGLGKSRLAEEILKDKIYLKILSHITPMQLYIMGFKFRDLPILIDDVDCLLYNEQNISLLKMFCETREVKRVSWLSTCGILREQGVPLSYETKSKVLILTNDFRVLSKKLGALQDRGWYIQFNPTDEKILNKIKEIKGYCDFNLNNDEINKVYDLIEKYSSFCKFSLRSFVKGLSLFKHCKNMKTDWRDILLHEMKVNSKLILIGKCIDSHNSDKERIKMWEDSGFSRRSFYDYKTKFLQKCRHISKTPAQLHNLVNTK
jgi:hypothetical protein